MVKNQEIKVSAPKVSAEATIVYPIGETLEDNVEKFGEEVVNSIFIQQLVVKVQAGARTALENGKDAQLWANGYVPGQKAPSIAADPKAAARAALARMSEEERLQLIRDLQAGN